MTARPAFPALAALVLALAACASSPPPRAASARAGVGVGASVGGGEAMTATRLYFGMAIPGGGAVSEADWRRFLAREVTPRFPDGLTVHEARGQWRDTRTGRLVRERSRVLLLLHRGTAKARAAIAAIVARYKARFEQRSVLRVDAPVRVRF